MHEEHLAWCLLAHTRDSVHKSNHYLCKHFFFDCAMWRLSSSPGALTTGWPGSSVQFTQSCPTLCDPMDYSRPGLPVHHQLPEFSQTHVQLSQWRYPTISFPVIPFSSCPQSFLASGSFPISQLFASGGQRIGVLASVLVHSMNTQDWSPLGWTDWISLQSKGLSRVFSNTTVQKHQFFGAQFSSQSNSHIHTWSLEKPGQFKTH